MEGKQINQLMVAMQRYGIKRLSLNKDGVELQLEREDSMPPAPAVCHEQHPLREGIEKHRVSHGITAYEEKQASADEKEEEEEGECILSPMVGTLYHSPSPGDPVFVKVGDTVDENTVVCLVEAMKVMNEVKAGVNGVVSEILVDNGHPVEFGTKLFKISS